MSKGSIRRKAKAVREELRALDRALSANDLPEIEATAQRVADYSLSLKHTTGRYVRVREA